MTRLETIEGIGEVYAKTLREKAGLATVEELLEAGVDTVKELRNRVPEHLHQKMVEVNEKKKLVRRLPGLSEVKSWVEQAKKLPPKVTY